MGSEIKLVPRRVRRLSRVIAPVPDWPARFRALAAEASAGALSDFYNTGVVAPETPLSDVPLVALDLETTGMRADLHGIVSVGLVPFTLDRIQCRLARYWVVRPRRALSEESVTIHRITHDELARAPDLGDILPDLLAALAGRVAVVHYLGIERPFLARAVRERVGVPLEFPLIDTMELEARVHRRHAGALLGRLQGFLGRKPVSLRLAPSRERYHLPAYQAHHALTDALASAELLQAQVAWRYRRDTPIGELWH